MRAWSSAARVCATSFAFANTCRLAAGPNARSNAAIGIHTYRSSETPPAVPCGAWMPTIRKPRPAMRTGPAERIGGGKQLVDDCAADHDDLRAAHLLVPGDGAPALDADVANVE